MSPALNFWTLLRSDGFPSLATASIHFHNCDAATDYYVIKVDANNFKLAVSLGVSALNFTSDDNAASQPLLPSLHEVFSPFIVNAL